MWSKLSSHIIRFLTASGILTIVSIILGLILPGFPIIDAIIRVYLYYILGFVLIIFILKEFGVISSMISIVLKLASILKIDDKPRKIYKNAKIALNNFFVVSGILLIVTVSLGLLLPQFPLLDLLIKNYAFPLLIICMTIVFGWKLNIKSLYLSMIFLLLFSILFEITISDFQGEIFGIIEYLILLIFLFKYMGFIYETK